MFTITPHTIPSYITIITHLNMQQEQQPTTCLSQLEKTLIDLTNQLLKNFHINAIPYLAFKIIQHLQMVYFLMRAFGGAYQWNYSFVGYFSLFLNYISLDQLFKTNPQFFTPILFTSVTIAITTLGLAVAVAMYSGWGKKIPFLIKLSTSVLCIFLYLFKTVLAIPLLNLIFLTLLPSLAKQYSLSVPSSQLLLLGTLLATFFLLAQTYLLTLFRQPNPFSELPHAGESPLKAVLWLLFKAAMAVYALFDFSGNYQQQATIIFTVVFLLFIVYSHQEVGLYRPFHKRTEHLLLYLSFVMALLLCLSSAGNQRTTLAYLLPAKTLAFLIYEWISQRQARNTATLNLQTNEDLVLLEKHVLYLIELIEGAGVKEKKVLLEGYLHLHRRECRTGESCPCHRLGIVKERNEPLVKIQFFKLVVSLLTESRKKFPQDGKIHLFLCLLYHYRTKNSLQAIYSISKMAAARSSNLLHRLYFSYYLQRIEEDMAEQDEKQVTRTNDINKYLDYSNKLVLFQNNIENCTTHHVDFWKLILDTNPEIKRLEDLGTLITRTKDQLKQQFESIFEINNTSVHLLIIYGRFLLEVTNEQTYNVKYLEKAENILKNIKESNKIDQTNNKYSENSNTAVVVISGNEGQLGIVVHTNNLLKNMLGYKRSEVIDRNVSAIMPKIYADSHHAVLTRYISASENKVNGRQRVVPALDKNGYMLPVTALTKALPSLNDGIQIAAFLSTEQQKSSDDDQASRKCNYILYRSDTEQIMGISQGCAVQYGISPSLVYGNPFNLNNQLKIKHLFGLSFEKSEEGRIAAALEVGEVFITLNTKGLKGEFIISKGGSSKSGIFDLDNQEPVNDGVELDVSVKTTLATVYNNVPLKLIAIYGRKGAAARPVLRKNSSVAETNSDKLKRSQKKSIFCAEEAARNDTDDMKNLKDFKNFISVKSQPSAITAINAICILFLLIVLAAVIALMINWTRLSTLNSNTLSLYQLTLQSQITTPELLTQTEKQLIALRNATGFTPPSTTNTTINYLLSLLKAWQLDILPHKYYFNTNYADQTSQYSLLASGTTTGQQSLAEALINDYISQVQMLITANMTALAAMGPNNVGSNLYQKYIAVKLNELYSIRQAYNASNNVIGSWYNGAVTQGKNVVVGINAMMMGAVVLWVVLLLPYILSVTKINNRVLSLFTLIPTSQVNKLIFNCLSFLTKNLTEASISPEDLKNYEHEPPAIREGSPHEPLSSPSQFNLTSFEHTQGEMRRPSDAAHRRDSMLGVEQKFAKMINSEDRNKKIVILKFIAIATIFLGFVLFYLLYSLGSLANAQNNLNNYFLLGRRPALIRNVKLLLTQFLLSPNYTPTSSLSSIRTLNTNIISQFYQQQANLLSITLGSYQSLFNTYNSADVCALTSTYSAYSLFNDTFTPSECYSFNSAVLQKGLTTGIVSVLEDIRSTLSTYTNSAPNNILTSKILQYDTVVKYIETPMLAVLAAAQNAANQMVSTAQLVVVLTGSLFLGVILACWRLVWNRYLSELNVKIWRTKGLLNLIPMRIITANDLLKNQFTSGQLEKAVR